MSRTVRVDPDVAEALIRVRLPGESVSATLRRLLGLPPDPAGRAGQGPGGRARPWFCSSCGRSVVVEPGAPCPACRAPA